MYFERDSDGFWGLGLILKKEKIHQRISMYTIPEKECIVL